jgi:hypothetical protein
MTRTFKVWLDSGANIQSSYEQEITLEDMCVTGEEWDCMPDDEKEELMKDFAWDRMGWGYREITNEN